MAAGVISARPATTLCPTHNYGDSRFRSRKPGQLGVGYATWVWAWLVSRGMTEVFSDAGKGHDTAPAL
jgi:hypothetical protein